MTSTLKLAFRNLTRYRRRTLLTALLILSMNFGNAFAQLPLWFPIVIISLGCLFLGHRLLLRTHRDAQGDEAGRRQKADQR